MTETEKVCVDIYLEIHVSKLKELTIGMAKAWRLGQELYTDKTKSYFKTP
jgi:hypothetical protein